VEKGIKNIGTINKKGSVMERISEIKHDIKNGQAHLEFNKQLTISYAAKLYTWIMETEERVLIETLALNSGKESLIRLRGVIDKALEMAENVKTKKEVHHERRKKR